MPQTSFHKNNQEGFIIIAAVMMLALLTIIAVSALNTSTTEVKIATNELLYEKTFYAAESGLQHIKQLLGSQLVKYQAVNPSSTVPNWSFALKGAQDTTGDGKGDYDGGVEWINREIDGITVRVSVWNNADSGDSENDTDGLIYARSAAQGPWGSACSIEILLKSTMSGFTIGDYSAQQGAGPGKNYISDDIRPMTSTSFDNQLTLTQ
jgi:type II secretory pathway pseudopilin PulG